MTKPRKSFEKGTVRRRTRSELFTSVKALTPYLFWRGTLETPESNYYFGFLLSVVAGAVFASPHIARWTRRRPVADTPGHNEPEVSVNIWSVAALWFLCISFTVLAGGKGGSDTHAAFTDPLAPWWHRAWVVLLANYMGWSAFCIWRALFNFTAELLRDPPPTNAVASVTPPAVFSVAAAQAIPAAAPVVLQNGVTRP